MTIEEHMARAMCKASGRDPDKIVPPPRARIRALTAENEAMRREKGNIAAIAKDLADRGYSGDAIAAAIRSGK